MRDVVLERDHAQRKTSERIRSQPAALGGVEAPLNQSGREVRTGSTPDIHRSVLACERRRRAYCDLYTITNVTAKTIFLISARRFRLQPGITSYRNRFFS